MAGRNSHHVVSNPKGGWGVKREGSDRALKTFDNQQEAVNYARHVTTEKGGEVVIHSRNGRIRDKETHRPGPLPPKDKPRHRK
jgi:hypothetical protein